MERIILLITIFLFIGTWPAMMGNSTRQSSHNLDNSLPVIFERQANGQWEQKKHPLRERSGYRTIPMSIAQP